MMQTILPQSHEQRKIEQLIVKLSKVKPVSAKPAPIAQGMPAIRASCTWALGEALCPFNELPDGIDT